MKDEGGSVTLLAFEGRDVSARKACEDEIARRRDELAAALNQTERNLKAKIAERTAELVAEPKERERVEGSFRLLVQGIIDYAIYMLDPHGIIDGGARGQVRGRGLAGAQGRDASGRAWCWIQSATAAAG